MKKNILIIDQDPDFLALYDYFIFEEDFHMTRTARATVGLSLVQQQKFDLLILDHELKNDWGRWFLQEQAKLPHAIESIVLLGNEKPSQYKFKSFPHVFIERKDVSEKLPEVLKDLSKSGYL